MLAARVLPDVAGFDRELDYELSEEQRYRLTVGSIVRVPLQGRKVRGWVLACPVSPGPHLQLRPVEKIIGFGPEPELVDLAPWAAHRWAGRRRHLLSTASPARAVRTLPPAQLRAVPPAEGPWSALLLGARQSEGPQLLEVAPAQPLTDLVLAAAALGPVLVLAPTSARAASGAASLRRRGASVAHLPQDWEQARAGASVVIGARAAAWGPCPGLSAVVVLDAHDESYAQHQAPTWWAPAVAAERARRAGVPCFWVSPCPTLEMRHKAVIPSLSATGRPDWPVMRVVDLRDEDPRTGLLSEALVGAIRHSPGRTVCVLNRKGRAQLLACAACSEVARCEVCHSGLVMERPIDGVDVLECRRCGRDRPVVCASCGSDRVKALRPGVTRVRDHLETLLGTQVAEVVGGSAPIAGASLSVPGASPPAPGAALPLPGAALPVPGARVVVGTEAVLHRGAELRRGGEVSLVAFLDFDQELLAPRYRAAEEAIALLALGARLLGPRRPGTALLVQTRVPEHPVLRAVSSGQPSLALQGEEDVRRSLRLPPFAALAIVSGDGAGDLAGRLLALQTPECAGLLGGIEVRQMDDDRWLVRAPDEDVLADALAGVGRPEGRVRVEVGPVRL